MPKPPVLANSIPPQVIYQGAAYGPFDLKNHIKSPDEESGGVSFFAELADGSPLPQGLICISDGVITGTPAEGTEGEYDVAITAENDYGLTFTTRFPLIIKHQAAEEDADHEALTLDLTSSDTLQPPFLAKPIPSQIINEGANYSFDLKNYIQSPNKQSGKITFYAELSDGRALPQGLICLNDGIIGGIPAAGTEGSYEFVIAAENDSGIPFTARFAFTIKKRVTETTFSALDEIKSKIWDALAHNLPAPDVGDLLNRPITLVEIYYLLERFATITVWDVFNLDPPGEKHLLTLEGASKHYNVYDRGSCIVAAPKDLFSHERTLEDALQTARAIAREVYKRNWTIEMAGFDKMNRACWIELQLLAKQYGKVIEVLRYVPSQEDLNIYAVRASNLPAPGAGI